MAIIARARAMRKALTPAEARLWVALRELRRDGLHFRRQAPMRGYILDFFCWDRGVIVEVMARLTTPKIVHERTAFATQCWPARAW